MKTFDKSERLEDICSLSSVLKNMVGILSLCFRRIEALASVISLSRGILMKEPLKSDIRKC